MASLGSKVHTSWRSPKSNIRLFVLFFFYSDLSLPRGVAVDFLPPYWFVYRLDCVESHRVHVSYRHLSTPGLWPSFLSSSWYVSHQYSSHFVLFTPSHYMTISVVSLLSLCLLVLLWFVQIRLSINWQNDPLLPPTFDRIAEMVFNWIYLPGNKVKSALSNPKNRILCYKNGLICDIDYKTREPCYQVDMNDFVCKKTCLQHI